MLSKLLILSSVFAFASAACPNRCSGHGNCGSADICECHPRWQGPDCSERQCPFGRSWSVTQDDTYSATVPAKNLGGNHAYTECSSKGTCDRTTGECQCFEGYSGRGCRRMACPNDCSGHGRCVSVSSQNASYTGTNAAKFGSQTWDMDGAMFCACDRGYESNDCSSRICPKGDDPVTDCSTGGAADANSKAHTMTQRLYVETTANDSTVCLSEATSGGLTQVDPTLYASAKSAQQGSSSDEVYLKRMDGSPNGRKCLHGDNSVEGGAATSLPFPSYTAGHFYGYISLKYTDMFGGEYFTRPILIDTSTYATMLASTDVPAFETSYNDSSQTGGGNNMDTKDTTQRLLKMSLSSHADFDTIGEVETLATSANIAMGHLADVSRNAMLEGTHNSANALKENLKRYTADRIRSALEELPNFAIPRVNVTNYYDSSSSSFWGNVFDIQFTDDATSGKQNLLECVYSSERACPGAQPRMANADPFGARKHGLGYTDKEKRTHQGECKRLASDGNSMVAVSGVTTKEECQNYDGASNNEAIGGQCMNCMCGREDGPTSSCNTNNNGQCYGSSVTLAAFLTALTEEACNALNGNQCTPEMIAYYKQFGASEASGGECDTAALPAVWVPNVWVEAALPINGETTFINYCNVYEVPLSTGKDYEENAECSNRGLCDSTTGQCACFDGHTGEACSTQTVFF